MFYRKEPIFYFTSFILVWVLLFNFSTVSFSSINSESNQKRTPEISQPLFNYFINISEQVQKKENHKRLTNPLINFHLCKNKFTPAPYFTSFVKKTELNNLHHYYFLTSHFYSTGT